MKANKVSIFILSLVCLFSCDYGTGKGEQKITSREFLSKAFVPDIQYSKDSLEASTKLRAFLASHEQSFYNTEYSYSTSLDVDTIMYNNDLSKIALFVIVKTPMNRRPQSARNNLYDAWYDAYCYIGVRVKDSLNLKWVRRFYEINLYNLADTRSSIRSDYFTQFATIKDTSGAYHYKYNIDDTRFWTSAIWEEYFQSH